MNITQMNLTLENVKRVFAFLQENIDTEMDMLLIETDLQPPETHNLIARLAFRKGQQELRAHINCELHDAEAPDGTTPTEAAMAFNTEALLLILKRWQREYMNTYLRESD